MLGALALRGDQAYHLLFQQLLLEEGRDVLVVLAVDGAGGNPAFVVEIGIVQRLVEVLVEDVEVVDSRGDFRRLVITQVQAPRRTLADRPLPGTANVDVDSAEVHGRVDLWTCPVVAYPEVPVCLAHAVGPTDPETDLGPGFELAKGIDEFLDCHDSFFVQNSLCRTVVRVGEPGHYGVWNHPPCGVQGVHFPITNRDDSRG